MKRILILNNEFPPIGAGAGTASYHFAQSLADLGHNVTVLTAGFRNLPHVEHQKGVMIRRLSCLRKKRAESTPLELVSYTVASIRYLRKKQLSAPLRYDVSLCFHAIPAGLIGYALHKSCGIPYVILLRGGDVPGFLPERFRLHHFISSPLTHLIWRKAHRIIANSVGLQALAEKTSRKIGRHVHLIPNGVNLSAIRKGNRNRGNGNLQLLYVGRLDRQKGLTYLLRALAMLPTELMPKIRLKLIGDGPERRRLECLSKGLGLTMVYFCGYLPHAKVLENLRMADLFVLPSLYEGMSNSLLEAMAAGLPALVTDIMGNNELVGHYENGLLVPPRNSNAISAALRQILGNRSILHQFRQNTLHRIRSMDWSHQAKSLSRYL